MLPFHCQTIPFQWSWVETRHSLLFRFEPSWITFATSSLPVLLSPRIRTEVSEGATNWICFSTFCMAIDFVIIWNPSLCDGIAFKVAASFKYDCFFFKAPCSSNATSRVASTSRWRKGFTRNHRALLFWLPGRFCDWSSQSGIWMAIFFQQEPWWNQFR